MPVGNVRCEEEILRRAGDETDELSEVEQNAIRDLDVIVRSRCPFLMIESIEEMRILMRLRQYCITKRKKLIIWDCVNGPICLFDNDGGPSITDPNNYIDPYDMLGWIDDDNQVPGMDPSTGGGGGGVYVLRDLHRWMQASTESDGSGGGRMDANERDLIRKMRSMAEDLKKEHKTVVILAPVRSLPDDAREIFTIIEWPLPSYEEIHAHLEELLRQFRNKVDGLDPSMNRNIPEFDAEAVDEMSRAFTGMTLARISSTFKTNTVRDYNMTPEEHIERIVDAKKEIISNSDCGLTFIDTENLPGANEIGGLEQLKQYINRRRQHFSEAARAYGLPNLKGILLIGVQGCGKSMVAKSVGKSWRLPTLRLDVGAVFSGLVGASETRMRRAIKYMEAMAPCVVWLDEIEKSMAGTGSSDRSDAGTAARVFSTMLTWMSDKESPVYIVATANDVSQLPPELIRAGRFDEKFFVDLPTENERIEIFSKHIMKVGRNPGDYDLDHLAEAADNFSGAEIEAVVIEAMTNAFDDGAREFTTDDVHEAIMETFPLAETMAERIAAIRGWARDRCRPASQVLNVNDRMQRRREGRRRLMTASEEEDDLGEMAGVEIEGVPKSDDDEGEGPDLGD